MNNNKELLYQAIGLLKDAKDLEDTNPAEAQALRECANKKIEQYDLASNKFTAEIYNEMVKTLNEKERIIWYLANKVAELEAKIKKMNAAATEIYNEMIKTLS